MLSCNERRKSVNALRDELFNLSKEGGMFWWTRKTICQNVFTLSINLTKKFSFLWHEKIFGVPSLGTLANVDGLQNHTYIAHKQIMSQVMINILFLLLYYNIIL